MSCATSFILTPSDQFELDRITLELDEPNLPTERLLEMLAELSQIAKRYECDLTLSGD